MKFAPTHAHVQNCCFFIYLRNTFRCHETKQYGAFLSFVHFFFEDGGMDIHIEGNKDNIKVTSM